MAKKSNTIITIEYAAARVGLGLMGLLPRALAVRLGIVILRSTSYVLKSIRRTGMRNLEIAYPEKTLDERKLILDGTFENLGRVLGELSQFNKYTALDLAKITDFAFDPATQAVYDKNKSDGRGVLLATGHMGNWEMLVFAFAALYEPISYLARPLDNPYRLSDAALLPDGRILLLARTFGPAGFAARLLLLDQGRVKSLARLGLGRLDNAEAIAAESLPGGGVRLWVMTDNDFRRRVPTLLVALDWPG